MVHLKIGSISIAISTKWNRLSFSKKTFVFTSSEIVNEFLMSIGYLEGAHDVHCLGYKRHKMISVDE